MVCIFISYQMRNELVFNHSKHTESLKAIAETIHVTMEISGLTIPYVVGTLERLALKPVSKVGHIEVPLWQGFPRNASEGQLSAFKQASKTRSNIFF